MGPDEEGTMSQDRDCVLVAPLVGELYSDLRVQLAPTQGGQNYRYKGVAVNRRDMCVCACVSELREREGGE